LFGKCLSNHLVLQKKREARKRERKKRERKKRERKKRVRKNLAVNGTWLYPQQRARPGPAPDNVLLLSSATAQNVTGKQNRTGSYKLLTDGAMSVSKSLTL